jgi:hypothetical protein
MGGSEEPRPPLPDIVVPDLKSLNYKLAVRMENVEKQVAALDELRRAGKLNL